MQSYHASASRELSRIAKHPKASLLTDGSGITVLVEHKHTAYHYINGLSGELVRECRDKYGRIVPETQQVWYNGKWTTI